MAETRQSVMVLLLLLHQLIFFTHAEIECPSDYTPSPESGTCVKFVFSGTRRRTWSDARSRCQGEGGDLVKIVNIDMNDLIYEMSAQDSDFVNQKDDPWTWIGLNDINSEGIFVWLDENEEAAWTNWYSTQPSSKTGQDCVVLYYNYGHGQWGDMVCDEKDLWDLNSYVCEAPALTTTTSLATTTTTKTTTPSTTPAVTTSTRTTFVTTLSPADSSGTSMGGLSGTTMAGIVIGAVVVVALVLVVFFGVRRFKNPQRSGKSVAYSHGGDDREAIVTME